MMGILYLVLLGIAATTVTDHVLDAFRNLTVSLETSTKNVQSTVNNTFGSFEATIMKSDPLRATPIHDKAKTVQKDIAALNGYINEIKDLMIREGGGIEETTGDVKARADIDISPRLMIKKGTALELKKRINDTKTKICAIAGMTKEESDKLALTVKDPPRRPGTLKTTWEDDNFGEGIPLTAAITALTKIQADLKNTEAEVETKILGRAVSTDVVLDQFEAVAVAPSSYILVGQEYKASVFLTASSSTSNPEIVIGGQKLNVSGGKGIYTTVAQSEGEKTWSGVIRVKDVAGKIKEYPVTESYTVARPSAVVSPDKMNVFYIGIPNPVSISAAGFAKDKIHPSISSGELSSHGNGSYSVMVKNPGEVTISVSGTMENGKSTVLGSYKFRTKRIPAPRVKFAGKAGGKIGTGEVKANNRIFAILDDFEFDAKFDISHFTMYIVKPKGDPVVLESNSNAFTPQMQAAANGVTSGCRLFIDNVFATGPDGMKRQLDPIAFMVN